MKLILFVLQIYSSQFLNDMHQNSPDSPPLEDDRNMSSEHSRLTDDQISWEYLDESDSRSYEHINTYNQYPTATSMDSQHQVSSFYLKKDECFDQNSEIFLKEQKELIHEIDCYSEINDVPDSVMYDLSSNQSNYQGNNSMLNYQHDINPTKNSLQVNNHGDMLTLLSNDQNFSTFDPKDVELMNTIFKKVEEILPENVLNDLANENMDFEDHNLYLNEIPQSATENNFNPSQKWHQNTKNLFVHPNIGKLAYYPNPQPFSTSQTHEREPSGCEAVPVKNREMIGENFVKFSEFKGNSSTSVHLQQVDFSRNAYKDINQLKIDFLNFIATNDTIKILDWIFKSIKKRIRFKVPSSYNYISILEFHINRIDKINHFPISLQNNDFNEIDEYCNIFLDFLKKIDISLQHNYSCKENELSLVTNYLYPRCVIKKKARTNLLSQLDVYFCILSRLEEIVCSLDIKKITESDFYMFMIQEVHFINKKYDILPELYSIEILIYDVSFFKRKSLLILALLKTIRKMMEENLSQNLNHIKTCKDIILLILVKKLHLERTILTPDDSWDTSRNMFVLSYTLISFNSRYHLLSKMKQKNKSCSDYAIKLKGVLIDIFCVLQHLLVIEICNYKQVNNRNEINNCFSRLSRELTTYKSNIKDANNFDLLWINLKLYEFIVTKNFLELLDLREFKK